LAKFTRAFGQVVDEAVECERAKYSNSYNPPDEDKVPLEDEIIEKIEDDVIQWRESPRAVETGGDANPPIPPEMRITSAFFLAQQNNDCDQFTHVNGKGFFDLEIIKLLILYDEMEPVLRECAHEEMGIAT
jgi:hypothetical protein